MQTQTIPQDSQGDNQNNPQQEDQNTIPVSDQNLLKKLRLELEEMTELAKRGMADIANLKRRQEEEKRELILMANANLIKKLLPELNNLELAKAHLPESAQEWFKGVEMSLKNIEKALEESGLKKIHSLNQAFNPQLHSALISGPGPKDIVIAELAPGYILGDRVIRHAQVQVGNGESQTENDNASSPANQN